MNVPREWAVEIVGEADSETPDGMAKAENANGVVSRERRRGYETDG